QEHRDLVAVWRRPIVHIDHFVSSSHARVGRNSKAYCATCPLVHYAAHRPLMRPTRLTQLLPGFNSRGYDIALDTTACRNRRMAQAFASENGAMEPESVDTGAVQAKPERTALFAFAAAGIALVALSPLALHFLFAASFEGFVAAALAQGAVYAFAVWLVLRHRFGRAALAVVFTAAVIARAIALPAPAILSPDVPRYVWGGPVPA